VAVPSLSSDTTPLWAALRSWDTHTSIGIINNAYAGLQGRRKEERGKEERRKEERGKEERGKEEREKEREEGEGGDSLILVWCPHCTFGLGCSV